MTTQAQMDANKRNALLSTGPKTKKGKKASKANAASHGLLAISPVLPGEDAKLWLVFSDAIRTNLSPVGAMEEELVERIVFILWRHKRLQAYEVALSADKIDKLEAASIQEPSQLSKLKSEIKKAEEYKHLWQSDRQLVRIMQKGDQNASISDDEAARYFTMISETVGQNGYDLFNPEFLRVFGIEEAILTSDVDPFDVVSWNVGHLYQAAEFFAQLAGCDREKAIEQLRKDKEENYIEHLHELKMLKKQLLDLSAQHEVELCRVIARNCMLAQAELEKFADMKHIYRGNSQRRTNDCYCFNHRD